LIASGSQTFPLNGSLGLRDAARLSAELAEALARPGPLTIDCTALAGVDLAIVQLLVAAHKTAAAAGKPLALVSPPGGPLAALLRQAGFIAPDGRPLTPQAEFWSNAEGKAA
jgi:anti-anti-sigma regulatory factor